MTDTRPLLAALQQADSFFPSGGFSFSWGLERLAADGAVRSHPDVARFLAEQLRQRWATFDRVALVAAHRAGEDFETVAKMDEAVEAGSLPALIREGSRRAGAGLLSVHCHIGTARAEAYRARLDGGHAMGHLPVIQGLVWGGLGLGESEAEATAAYTFTAAVLSAALRLGLIGHLGAQRILNEAREIIAVLLEAPAPEELGAYTPLTDIAAMRHETSAPRLFAN